MVLDFAFWIFALEYALDVVIIIFVVDAMDDLLEKPDKWYDLLRSHFCGPVACREDGYRMGITTTTKGHLSVNVAISKVMSESVPSIGVAYLESQILRLYPRK